MSAARTYRGFAVNGSVLATDGSAIRIRNSSTESSAGGFLAQGKYVKLTNKSGIHMQNVRAKQYAGGFYARSGSVIVANMSEITVVNGHVAKYDGGAFVSRSHLQVDDGSTIRLQNVSAGRSGGGFTAPRARVFVRGNSEVLISDSHAKDGGGFYVAFLEVSNNAVVGIQNSTAGRHGGGFYACGCNNTFVRSMDRNVVVVSHSSTLRIENTIAERRGGGFLSAGSVMLAVFSKLLISDSQTMRKDGGGFYLFGSLQIEDGSILRVRNVYAYKLGGAFAIDAADTAGAKATVVVRNKSVISIDNATAGLHAGGFHTGRNGRILVTGHSKMRIADCRGGNGHGGGFFTDRLQVSDHGAVTIRNCSAGGDSDGGGFYAQFGQDKTEAAVVLADSSTLSIHATNASYAGGFSTPGQVVIASNSMLRISESHASTFSGGFSSSTLQVIDHSAVFIENVTAAQEIGGFTAGQGLVVSNGSEISIRRAVVEKSRAGFASFGPIVVAKNSQISVSDSFARNGCCGGFSVRQELAGALAAVQVTGGSTISISNTAARLEGGGFAARRGDIVVNNGSKITIRNTASSSSYGGGFSAEQGVLVSNNSLITIRDSTSREHSGGFCSKRLEVTSRSAVQIERTQAGGSGGGFSADDAVVAGQSKVTVSDSHAIEGSGGGFQTAKLYLESNSSIDLRTTSAGNSGGGVYADNFKAGSHALVVANGSTLGVGNATARVDGGGLCIYGRAVITGWSKVHTSDCHTTLLDGGGVAVFESLLLNESSDVHIQNATAGRSGGGLHAEGTITIAGSSTLATSNTSCEEDGGDSPPGLALHDGMFVVSDSRSTGKGAAGFVQDRVFLGPGSGLYVHKAVGSDLSSVVAARSLQLSPGATVLLEDAVGGLGLDLRNSDCPSALANRTVEIAAGASLKASGRLGSGFLSLETCPFEVVHLSGIHLQSWSSPLLSTQAHKVVVRDVSIDYEPPLHDVLVLATIVDVSCKNCTHGVALNATGSELRALSTPLLICPLAASVSGGMLQRCTCANNQTTRQAYTDRQVVMLQDIMNTCTFCEPHTQFINGTCQKCPPFNAWSDGKSDVCHVLPQDSAQVGALFAVSASCVFLAFVFYQILDAPLVIVDAKSQRIPHRLRKAAGKFPEGMEQRSFSMSLQGPIVDLPQFLSRQLHRQLCYHVKGTGLQWLDFSPENAQAVKIQSIDRSKLEVQDAHVPYDCAAAVGALHATNLMHLMLPLCAALFLVVLLPVALQVAIMSGNGIAHVLVTSAYCALPAGLAALILHPVVAWLIEQHCRRTPFSKLLDNYRRRIASSATPALARTRCIQATKVSGLRAVVSSTPRR
ncbi:pmpB [Symbiodinium microadriaticum]|nr:pmpB [Symbiodinium microadriaticum]CAE7534676.1 pmpB [Symbiodinium sp. KB8]